jgi:hypothetical protein
MFSSSLESVRGVISEEKLIMTSASADWPTKIKKMIIKILMGDVLNGNPVSHTSIIIIE